MIKRIKSNNSSRKTNSEHRMTKSITKDGISYAKPTINKFGKNTKVNKPSNSGKSKLVGKKTTYTKPNNNSTSKTTNTKENSDKPTFSTRKKTANKVGLSFKSKSLPGQVKRIENEIRLNKAIADSGLVSRRKADELIESGVVKVNGKIVVELGMKVSTSDNITVNGDPIPEFSRLDYILLNKPKNYICTNADEKNRKTIFDIVKSNERVFAVGRLDRNTTGVILITNDGELTNRLTHPSYNIQKTYIAKLDKEIKIDIVKQITEGVELEDGKTSPAFVVLDPKDRYKITITITEGRNREVRRIFEHFGFEVISLNRKLFGGLSAKGLNRGEYRRLNRDEISYIKKLVGVVNY